MNNYMIKLAETESEKNGRGYVHFQSWQETYPGLVDETYLQQMSLEKCISIAHRFPDNILIAKDGEKVIGFAAYGAYRDDTLIECGEIYAIYVLQEYQGQKVGWKLMNAAINKLSLYGSTKYGNSNGLYTKMNWGNPNAK